jgi:chromosome segregation ATPase
MSTHLTQLERPRRTDAGVASSQRAAAQLARVVVSAEASHASLSNALLEAHTELRPLREAVVNAAARLRAEQEQHGMTKAALRHATTRAQVLEQRLYELSQTLSGE